MVTALVIDTFPSQHRFLIRDAVIIYPEELSLSLDLVRLTVTIG